MRRRNRQIGKAAAGKPVRMGARDAFQNALARLGVGMPNLLEGTSYPMTRLTRDFNLLNSLYRSHWVVRRIVDTIPQDMTKNWIQVTSKISPELLEKAVSEERRVQLSRKILKGLRWGRLYGGAIGLMLIKGQGDDLAEPLDLERIMPGDFQGIMILDRWNGCYPSTEECTDISDPEFGMPDYYYVTDPETQASVYIHHSRILRFEGLELPFWESQAEQYWGASIIEIIFDELKKRDNVSWNIAQLTFMAQLRVLKVKDMDQLISTLDPEAVKEIYSTIQMQNWLMSSSGMQLLGSDDDFVTHQYTFGGVADVYEQFMMDVAGAAEIPVTKLFGRSPAGLNATGESDLQNYYDMIEEKQESMLRPILDKVMPVHAMSSWGFIPDDLDYKFNPVQRTTQEKLAQIVQQRTSAVLDAYNAGIIGRKTALRELQQMKDETGMWSNITDDIIDEADDDVQSGEMDMGGQGGMGGTLEDALAAKAADADYPKDPDPDHWRTINGAKVHLDANGNYNGGAGGKFNGQHHWGPDYKEKNDLTSRLATALKQGGEREQKESEAKGQETDYSKETNNDLEEEFIPAHNFQEASKYMRQFCKTSHLKIDDGFRMNVLNSLNEALHDVYQRFGNKLLIQEVRRWNRNIGNFAGSYNPLEQRLTLKNQTDYQMAAAQKKWHENGYWASGHKYGTLYHEIGHVVWEDLPEQAKIEVTNVYKRLRHESYLEWMQLGGSHAKVATADIFGKQLSRYAMENEKEFFSEAFSQIMERRPRPISREIRGILDKYYTSHSSVRDADWDENKHPRRPDGKFGSGGGASRQSDIINPTGKNTFNVPDFRSKQKLNNHWSKHKGEYPGWTKEQYKKRAVELVESSVGGTILGHMDRDGVITRYDERTNDFVKGHSNKGIYSMMKPVEGKKYYEKMRQEDLDRGGKG